MYDHALKIQELITISKKIVIIQADNPDGDSLASSLALEGILGDMGKEVVMYCGVDMPTYLHYLSGWDRVVNDLPKNFDLSIIVDTSAIKLLEQLGKTGQLMWLKAKPSIVLDHHTTEADIDFANVLYITQDVSTGELIYDLANRLEWSLNDNVLPFIATSILSDSMGLMTEATTAKSIRVIADIVERGVSLAAMEELRRSTMRKSIEITRYKGQLLQRIEYFSEDRIATVSIPWEEIEMYSNAYNPSILVIDEMRLTTNTQLAICFKLYPNGKVTAKIRSNYGVRIANLIAEHFGGGGHPYAAGFKVQDGRLFNDIKSECIAKATELLDNL